MKKKGMPEALEKTWVKLKSNKYAALVLALGLVLILLPTGGKKERAEPEITDSTDFSLEEEQRRIAGALKRIDGAGDVEIVLTLKTGTQAVVATDTDVSSAVDGDGRKEDTSVSTVIISQGSSTETPVTLKTVYPEYQGALVVAEGAGNAEIKLRLTEAVSGLTGLTTDRITVVKMKSS